MRNKLKDLLITFLAMCGAAYIALWLLCYNPFVLAMMFFVTFAIFINI